MAAISIQEAVNLYESGQYSTCFPILRDAALAGDTDLQSIVGVLMIHGLHRFMSQQDYEQWERTASDIDKISFMSEIQDDILVGVQLLQAASEKGSLYASTNLGTYYFTQGQSLGDETSWRLAQEYWRKAEEQKRYSSGSDT